MAPSAFMRRIASSLRSVASRAFLAQEATSLALTDEERQRGKDAIAQLRATRTEGA